MVEGLYNDRWGGKKERGETLIDRPAGGRESGEDGIIHSFALQNDWMMTEEGDRVLYLVSVEFFIM